MLLCTPHSDRRARAGHTLVELLVAAVSGSMLLAALASTTYIATQIAYSPLHAQKLLRSTNTAFDLVDELKYAIHIVDHSANSIEFVTDDRNGDSVEDTIRYAWSGTAGDPLTRSFNRGAPAAVVEDVHDFQLHYAIEQAGEDIEVVSAGDELQLEPQYTSALAFDLKQGTHLAQAIDLSSLPASTRTWALTKIHYEASPDASTTGEFAVQLRTATAQGTPTSEILAEYIVLESSLGSGGWITLTPPEPISGLSPHGNYCIVFAWRSGSTAAKVHLADNLTGAVETTDDGATWRAREGNRAQVIAFGAPVVPDKPLTVYRDRLRSIEVSLQRSDSSRTRIDTSVQLVNKPVLTVGMLATEFESDPTTQDRNGDGSEDFALAEGGSFDDSSLADGWWNAADYTGRLSGDVGDDASQPLDVRFRAQASTAGADGAVLDLHVRLSGTQKGLVRAGISLDAGGTQTLELRSYNGTDYNLLGRVEGLPSDPIDVRLVADPPRRVWVYSVNGVQYPALTFPAYNDSLSKHQVHIYDSGAEGKFDYVYATQPKDG